MAREKAPAQKLCDEMLSKAIAPILKLAGFRKDGANFHRRNGETVQVVNFQSSTDSNSNRKRFYINVGIAFDAICALIGRPVLERPKEYECDERGTRNRIRHFITEAPDDWALEVGGDCGKLAADVANVIAMLLPELTKICDPKSYATHPWFGRVPFKQENAQVLYLVGDLDGAWSQVVGLAEIFKGRANAEWWVDRLGLQNLKPRLKKLE